MNLEREFETRFGKFPISNIAYYLVIGQVLAYILSELYPGVRGAMMMRGSAILSGEWWRIFTLLFIPSGGGPLFTVLQWCFMYMLGMALEQIWGAFRLSLYLTIAYAATLVGAFLFPAVHFSNGFIYSSLFLAFAHINPDFTILLFFILPVRIKWLAVFLWIGILQSILFGGLSSAVHAFLQIVNYLIFFGSDIRQWVSGLPRQATRTVSPVVVPQKTCMQCVVCHATELDRKIFYYCHDCHPEQCYCDDHIKNHKHKIVN